MRDYLPHKHCVLNDPGIVWGMTVTDVSIAFAYVAFALIYAHAWMKGILHTYSKSTWLNMSMAGFIFFCGLGHLLNAITYHSGKWYVDLLTNNVMTALVSWISVGLIVATRGRRHG